MYVFFLNEYYLCILDFPRLTSMPPEPCPLLRKETWHYQACFMKSGVPQ